MLSLNCLKVFFILIHDIRTLFNWSYLYIFKFYIFSYWKIKQSRVHADTWRYGLGFLLDPCLNRRNKLGDRLQIIYNLQVLLIQWPISLMAMSKSVGLITDPCGTSFCGEVWAEIVWPIQIWNLHEFRKFLMNDESRSLKFHKCNVCNI